MLEAIAAGIVTGLITWGGIRTELRWIRADIERIDEAVTHAHQRIDQVIIERKVHA